MNYIPREGVDFLYDLYSIVGVEHTASYEEIEKELKVRFMEYHPDRLGGLAPEFQERGERMTRLLTRANTILLDETKRAEYDGILDAWTGPISDSGIPASSPERELQAKLAGMTDEEIETIFTEQRQELETALGYTPTRLRLLERMIKSANPDELEELKGEYEAALLQYDRILAIQEAERSQLLGLKVNKGYDASLDYAALVTAEIEAARSTKQEEFRALRAGNFAARLALLSGEEPPVPADQALTLFNSDGLPTYFDQQAKTVQELAEEREAILMKRLENFEPTYPEASLQTEPREQFIMALSKVQLAG